MTTPHPEPPPRVRPAELVAAGLFAVALAAVPALCHELYPFSFAPMFSGSPQVYCTYHVRGPGGKELPPADFKLHRVYNANPPGLGVGRAPEFSFDRFGEAPPPDAVAAHVKGVLAGRPDLPFVDVTQEVVGDTGGGRVGVARTETFRVEGGRP